MSHFHAVKIKLEIVGSKEKGGDYWIQYDHLKLLSNQTYLAYNRAVSFLHLHEEFVDVIMWNDNDIGPRVAKIKHDIDLKYNKIRQSSSQSEKQKLSKQIANLKKRKNALRKNALEKVEAYYTAMTQNKITSVLGNEFPHLPSTVRSSIAQEVSKLWNEEKYDIFRGERSVRTYKKGCPIPFQKTAMTFKVEDGKYLLKLMGVNFRMVFGRDRGGVEPLIAEAINPDNENYSLCGSSIQFGKKKIILNLVLQIPSKTYELNPELHVGVNLGLRTPAYVALNSGHGRKPIGSADQLFHRRISLQRSLRHDFKTSKYNKGGHGRKRKLQYIEKYNKRERHYVQTMNHKFSREVIDFALSKRAGVIVLEDLSGYGQREKEEFFLRNWSYFELQNYIEYKAKRVGIEIQKTNPAYVSQICHKCLVPGKVGFKGDASIFICTNRGCSNHGKKINVDYNAAVNVANKIEGEKLYKEYMYSLSESEGAGSTA